MRRTGLPILLLLLVIVIAGFNGSASSKTIADLQPFRSTTSIKIKGGQGKEGLATLTNLNPNINGWYLLSLSRSGGAPDEVYHLENADSYAQIVSLDQTAPIGLVLSHGKALSTCGLWENYPTGNLEAAKKSSVPYAPLCGGTLYLRNPTKGHRTAIEAVTDFLRNEVPGGDQIVGFIRDTFFLPFYTRKAEEEVKSTPVEEASKRQGDSGPLPAMMDEKQANRMIKPADLGIQTEGSGRDGMSPGHWYAAKGNPGVYVSVTIPGRLAPEILRSHKNIVNNLDSVESEQTVYLVAFDLDRFEARYSLGTEHPGVGWSARTLDQVKDKSLPGPDGIGIVAPLIRTGLINPKDAAKTVATFTGGFKRHHGAFKYGELALRNHGSHYGFLENGVVFSTLQPGLSTIYTLYDGWTGMKTWTDKDDAFLSKLRYARQNGVPIISDFDKTAGASLPGALVAKWGPGNWSGSASEKLRTMRSGIALEESKGRRFLIYAFFWSATPSAMARVFQAYQVHYAMLTDMNALEHTYLAVYRRQGTSLYVQHLIQGMSAFDMSVKGQYVPRFLGYADDRDFFYLTRKERP